MEKSVLILTARCFEDNLMFINTSILLYSSLNYWGRTKVLLSRQFYHQTTSNSLHSTRTSRFINLRNFAKKHYLDLYFLYQRKFLSHGEIDATVTVDGFHSTSLPQRQIPETKVVIWLFTLSGRTAWNR